MMTLYANGLLLGSGPEFAQLIAGLADRKEIVEFRDETGRKLGHYYPPEPICPWDPSLTREEIERRRARGGMPLADFWKSMGVE